MTLVVLVRVNCSLGNLDPFELGPCFWLKGFGILLVSLGFNCIFVHLFAIFWIALFGSFIRDTINLGEGMCVFCYR
jgi:hypothetical protein